MGGLLQLFDFNQGGMARKILSHKRHDGGLEAPRNSLELQVDTSQNYFAVGDLPYSYQVEEVWSEKNSYPNEASMKKLINEEISKPHIGRQSAPSIVARLMGVDVLPVDTKPVVQSIKKKNENTGMKSTKKERTGNMERSGRGSIARTSFESNPSWRMEPYPDSHNRDRDDELWNSGQKYGKPRPREHPQEEELQKFKKEFEAWQAARFRECSRLVESDSIPQQVLAQENLNKEKIALYANSGRMGEKPVEPNGIMLKSGSHERGSVRHHGHKSELFPAEQKDPSSLRSRSRTLSREFEQSFLMNYDQKADKSSAPTRIVVLKPGPNRITDHEDSWTSSSGTLEERGSIEDFLEEVKERLKCELQGKTIKRGSIARGSGIETPYSERPSDPKRIARHIAKQVRDSVTRDLEINLRRSESTRSCRSEIYLNGLGSPEFIDRDTKRFLSERLRNVLKRETHLDAPTGVGGRSRSSMLNSEKSRLKHVANPLQAENEHSYWEIVNDDEQEMQTRSFRHGDDVVVLNKELSPRNLIRSLSAPVSGTSFGKLLLEDRHILTGAQIRRKHEAIENVPVDVRKRKKEKFNFKEKVSNFRYSFTLRGRLFGKKFQSFIESHNADLHPVKDIMSGPTVVMNLGERHLRENSTEVPPSPVSVCSSAQEEFWKAADNPSPLSTPDVNFGEDNSIPHFFKEISSNLIELRRKLNELESSGFAETTFKVEPVEPEIVDIEDYAEAYIRDLLVASGLYHGSSDKTLSRWDPLAKPISKSVYEEVEECYRKLDKDNESSTKDQNEKKIDIDHITLFDLLNEALSVVLGPPVSLSRFRRKIIGSSMLPPLKGRKLLDCVWEILREYLYPSTDISNHSLDNMVAHDLQCTPWCGLMDEEINDLGREVEGLVIGELVDDIVKDMQL